MRETTLFQPPLMFRYAVSFLGRTNPECTRRSRVPPSTFFNVKVTKVNTLNRQGKRKRNRRTGTWGSRPDHKRAIVTLAEGDSIDLFKA